MEAMLVRLNPWISRVGEYVEDGIAMSPDGVAFASKRHLLSPHEPIDVVHEFKASWKSSLAPIEEKVQYLQQTKSYCRALRTNYCVLWIFSVVGDYKFGNGSGPVLTQHHICYTKWELETNWSEVVRKRSEYGL